MNVQGLGTRLQYLGFEYTLISDIICVLKTGLATPHNMEGNACDVIVGHFYTCSQRDVWSKDALSDHFGFTECLKEQGRVCKYRRRCCHLDRQNGWFLMGLVYQHVELSMLAMILQVAFPPCIGMLTVTTSLIPSSPPQLSLLPVRITHAVEACERGYVMTSSLHNRMLELIACSVPQSELRIGLTVQFFLFVASQEVCRNVSWLGAILES